MGEELRLLFGKSGKAEELSKAAPTEIASQEEDDFEFTFSIESDPGVFSDISADEIFYNGRILPVYPIFNLDLIGEDRDHDDEEKLAEGLGQLAMEYEKRRGSRPIMAGVREPQSESVSLSSSLSSEAEDGAPKCKSKSPDRWRKSSSTGSSESASRSWKLRDLVVGRSRSDGKDRFVVIPLPKEKEKQKQKQKKNLRSLKSFAKSMEKEAEKDRSKKGKMKGKGKGEAMKEMDIVTAHRIYYGKGCSGGRQPAAAGNSHRSFLPYRQELLGGIFGTAKPHPF